MANNTSLHGPRRKSNWTTRREILKTMVGSGLTSLVEWAILSEFNDWTQDTPQGPGIVYRTHEQIGDAYNLSRTTVCKNITKLEEKGFLEVVEKARQHRAGRYRLLISDVTVSTPEGPRRDVGNTWKEETASDVTSSTPDLISPSHETSRNSDVTGPDPDVTGQASDVPPVTPERSRRDGTRSRRAPEHTYTKKTVDKKTVLDERSDETAPTLSRAADTPPAEETDQTQEPTNILPEVDLEAIRRAVSTRQMKPAREQRSRPKARESVSASAKGMSDGVH